MSKKLYTAVPALLLLTLIIGTLSGMIISVKSASPPLPSRPLVMISPEAPNVNVGETFCVTVSTSGLAGKNLYGFELLFVWNTLAVEYVTHEVKVPVETYQEGIMHEPIVEVKNEVDTNAGSCWLVYASMLPAEPFNNDGVIFTITFRLLKSSANPYALGPVVLSDKNGNDVLAANPPDSGTPAYVPGTHKVDERWVKKWLEWWITVTMHIYKPATKQ